MSPEADLARDEDSPAGTGWSNMGGGGDEHIGGGVKGGGDWEDWEASESYEEESEESDLFGEGPSREPEDE